MATHFICQATEPLPHRFPTTRPSEKGHGAVSQYELLNLGDKAHCRFPPPGWDTSESSEDSLPLYRAPVPSWKSSTIGPDPDLCLTPLKTAATKQNNYKSSLCDHDLDLTLTPEKTADLQTKDHKSNLRKNSVEDIKFKGQHRVRFELNNSRDSKSDNEDSFLFPRSGPAKPYKPTSYTDKEGVDSDSDPKQSFRTQNQPAQFTVNTSNKRTVYIPVKVKEKFGDVNLANHFEEAKIEDDLQTDISSVSSKEKHSSQSDSKPVCHIENHKKVGSKVKGKEIPKQELCVQKDNTVPKRKVKVKRETADQTSDYNFPFKENTGDVLEYEHVFNRPEYNSTMRLRSELQQIKDSEVNLAKALEKKLNSSDSTKAEIIEKATSKVNTKDSMFSGLISLEVPVEDLCNRVEQNKSSKVPTKSIRSVNQQLKHSNEPDLMEFFTPNLQREQAELSLPGLSAPTELFSTASHISAFDLYRHNRVWDNNSYFDVKKK